MRRSVGPVALLVIVALALPAAAYPRPAVTVRASVSSDGAQGFDPESGVVSDQFRSSLDASGRRIAFTSTAVNLVPLDANAVSDVFVHDFGTGRTQVVSVSSQGAPGIGSCLAACATQPGGAAIIGSYAASIDATGRYVAFASYAVNLVPGDTNLDGDIFVRDLVKHTTVRVSVSSSGRQGDKTSGWLGGKTDAPVAISPGGRFVTFSSLATNLVQNDTNTFSDVFVHDMATRRTIRASVGTGGVQGNRDSDYGSVVAHGRVAFVSGATNLTSGVTLPFTGVYVHDLRSDTTTRVDVSPDGQPADLTSTSQTAPVGLTADGRDVVFMSLADNLIPNDTNQTWDIFDRDLTTSRTERVDVTSTGGETEPSPPYQRTIVAQAIALSQDGVVSPDGRYVAFTSFANNLAVGKDGNPLELFAQGDPDIFLYDTTTGALSWMSPAFDGGQADDAGLAKDNAAYGYAQSMSPGLAGNGRYVSFTSDGRNIVEGDTNNTPDVFVRDRGPALGPEAVRVAGGGAPSPLGTISAQDRTNDVGAVLSRAGANLIGASLSARPAFHDLFVREDLAHMPPVAAADPAMLYGLEFRANGVRYEVRAQHAATDRFGLFRLDGGSWTRVAALQGGYGTTGEEVVFAIPARDVGLATGGRPAALRSFTAIGTYETGPVRIVDRLTLDPSAG